MLYYLDLIFFKICLKLLQTAELNSDLCLLQTLEHHSNMSTASFWRKEQCKHCFSSSKEIIFLWFICEISLIAEALQATVLFLLQKDRIPSYLNNS